MSCGLGARARAPRSLPVQAAVQAAPERADAESGGYARDGEGGLQQVKGPGGLAQGRGPVPLRPVQAGQCHTFAPEGWRVVDQNRDGTVFTLASENGGMVASYAGAAIGAGQVQGFYGPQYRTPESFALYAAGVVAGGQARQTGAEEPVGPYRAIRFSTGARQGWILLYTFRVPDPGGYGVVMRIAAGADAHAIGVAGAVAAATRCASTVHPSEGPVWHAPRDSHGAGSTGGARSGDIVGDYNAQLGTGWVHDDAGNVYNVDVSGDWSENGPDGPGFYKRNGNDVTKLQPGLG